MSKQNTKLPKWFKGQLYDKGDTVKNPFSGEVYELNNVELSMYDYIVGSQYVMEVAPRTVTSEQVTVNKDVTINGNSRTLDADFTKTDNGNNSAIGVQADGVTIQ